MANRENNYRGRVERDDIRVSRYVPEDPVEKVAGSGSASDGQRRVQQRGQRLRQPAGDVRVLRPGDGYRTQPPARAEQARAYAERHRKEQRSRAVRRGIIIAVACVAALVVGIVVARGGAGLALPSLGGSGSGDASATQGEQGTDFSQDAG